MLGKTLRLAGHGSDAQQWKSWGDCKESPSPGPGAPWEAWIGEVGANAGRLGVLGTRWFVRG